MDSIVEISGIKCDTPHCNYRDDDVKFEDFPKWINKPCPVCGKNLLTKEEYIQCIKLYSTVEKLNKISHKLRWFNPMFYINKILNRKPKKKEMIYHFPKRKIS